MKLSIATCQFSVSAETRRNLSNILSQMKRAKTAGADVVHFAECALSGYAGVDFEDFSGFDWDELRECSEEVRAQAKELGIWVIFGTSFRRTGKKKPHNSVFVIDARGRIVDRYDKRFVAGDASGKSDELRHFAPGDHLTTFKIKGVKCGVLICHEYRYPELHRELKACGTQLIFHSFHAGNVGPQRLKMMQEQVGSENHRYNRGTTLPEITMQACMQAASAGSHLWISCANTSAPESCWPAFFVRPDGVITGRLTRNRAGVLISEVDTTRELYDSTKAWRLRAMDGQFHSGKLTEDKRSRDRRTF